MKRKILIFTTIGIIALVGYMVYYARLPQYTVFNSHSMSAGGGYRDTDMNVVVYKNHNDKELYKKIESEHNHINGTPTELTINLYHSEAEIKKGADPYKIISIDYANNTYEISE